MFAITENDLASSVSSWVVWGVNTFWDRPWRSQLSVGSGDAPLSLRSSRPLQFLDRCSSFLRSLHTSSSCCPCFEGLHRMNWITFFFFCFSTYVVFTPKGNGRKVSDRLCRWEGSSAPFVTTRSPRRAETDRFLVFWSGEAPGLWLGGWLSLGSQRVRHDWSTERSAAQENMKPFIDFSFHGSGFSSN